MKKFIIVFLSFFSISAWPSIFDDIQKGNITNIQIFITLNEDANERFNNEGELPLTFGYKLFMKEDQKLGKIIEKFGERSLEAQLQKQSVEKVLKSLQLLLRNKAWPRKKDKNGDTFFDLDKKYLGNLKDHTLVDPHHHQAYKKYIETYTRGGTIVARLLDKLSKSSPPSAQVITDSSRLLIIKDSYPVHPKYKSSIEP